MNEKFLSMLNNDSNSYPTKLEQEYPHIFSKLVDLWESSQIKQYLDEIIFDARGDGMVSMTTLVMSFGSYIFID